MIRSVQGSREPTGPTLYSVGSLELAPEDQVFRLITGYRAFQAVGVAVELGIPDRVVEQPRTAAELAHATGTHQDSLHRVLRALCTLGVLVEDEQARFGPTALTPFLTSGQPNHAMVRMLLGEGYLAWSELRYSIRTGNPAYERVHGLPIWEHLAGDPDKTERFNAAMAAFAEIDGKALADACDLSEVSSLVDVGGGQGGLMAAVLRAHPAMRGTILDLKPGLARTDAQLEAAGVAGRCELVVGSFFDTVPAGGDAYVLRWILHDWDDNDAARILAACTRAMPPHARLLAIDRLMPERFQPTTADLRLTMADLHMMVVLGGRERTEAEFRALFANAGLKVRRTAPLPTGNSVLEAYKTSQGPA